MRGPLVNETTYRFSAWAVLTARSYGGREDVAEVSWQAGPLEGGKEVVVVYSSDITDTEDFYTDANGRQMVRRRYSEATAEREAGNYYPVTSRIELRNGGNEISR